MSDKQELSSWDRVVAVVAGVFAVMFLSIVAVILMNHWFGISFPGWGNIFLVGAILGALFGVIKPRGALILAEIVGYAV